MRLLSPAVLETKQSGRYGQSMSTEAEFSRAEIDEGRQLFAGDWDFLSAASSIESLPRAKGLEIAFAGRSNVGKSSLINALTGRRALARTSNTPGRTQELIFFGGPSRLVLVDLPGYGYAAAAKSKVTAWTRLIHDYLHGRAALARVYVLIDARHGLKTVDETILDTLGKAAVSHEIVLTKCDQVSDAELASLCRRGESGGAEKAGRFSRADRHLRPERGGHSATPRRRRALCWPNAPADALSFARHAAT